MINFRRTNKEHGTCNHGRAPLDPVPYLRFLAMETAAQPRHCVRFKTFELNLLTRELYRNGRLIRLRGHPIEVLAMLLERPGQLVTREEFQKKLWPKGTFVDFEQILNNSIRMLREALGDKAEAPQYIETLPRLGYRFIAQVTTGLERPNGAAKVSGEATLPQNDTASGMPTVADSRTSSPVRNRWRWIAATFIGLAVLVSAASIVHLRERHAAAPRLGDSQTGSALQIRPITNAPGTAKLPAFSPDGREIAFLWDGPERKHFDVYVQLLGSDTPLRITHSTDNTIGALAWSPDGNQIAFTRCGGRNDGVFAVPALGGVERKLTDVGCPNAESGPLSWLSNGQEILMIDHCPEAGTFDLVDFSLESGKKRCLTHSGSKNAFDSVFQFALSPDSRTIAFTASPAAPCQGEVYTIPLTGGPPHPLTVEGRCFADFLWTFSDLMWTPDGKSIVFISTRSVLPALWRVSAEGGSIQRETSYPAIGSFSSDGRRLVYSEATIVEGATIWRADLTSAGGKVLENRELIRTQLSEMSAQPSPDGTRIAWRSSRTGYGQIWVSGVDGENPLQLTHIDSYAGTPRWSPDGQSISFNGVVSNRRQVFVINSGGRGQRQITDGPYDNIEASWSRDSRSLYFASMRTGSWQVWKHKLDNGVELQVTKEGGFEPFESYDGQTVYYTRFYEGGIWSVPASGGKETQVIADTPQLGYWGSWGITNAGLYLLNNDAAPMPRIEFYNFKTRRLSPVLAIAKKPWLLQSSLSATADGKTIYYTVYDQQSVIKMMEIPR